jgi:hypothetical protein
LLFWALPQRAAAAFWAMAHALGFGQRFGAGGAAGLAAQAVKSAFPSGVMAFIAAGQSQG